MAVKVLAVDDEEDILRLVELKLKKAGFEVLTARDGEAGLRKAMAETPDVVVLDVMMPKMDGYTAAHRIKAEVTPAPIIVMLTARSQDTDAVWGLTGDVDDFIVKPFAPRELVARINDALTRAGKSAIIPR